MRRLSVHLLTSGFAGGVLGSALLLLPGLAHAAPPSLPEAAPEAEADDVDAGTDEALTADGQPMPTDTQAAGPGEDVDDGSEFETDFGAEGDAEFESDFGADIGGDTDTAGDAAFRDGDTGDGTGDVSMGTLGGLEGDNGPGMVAGRREPMMNTLRGPVGLYYTSLAGVGEKYTVRMRLHTDFFVKNDFFCCEGGGDGDRHARLRGAVNLGFTFT